mmetsp:Transcript_59839/g.129667  ORF Transcript_59839/g.129667 Transcript_59839/m.129667 type:complete len:479 (-) Transcript_59839:33-1469(-)
MDPRRLCWSFLLFIVIWRWLTSAAKVQLFLHRWRNTARLALALQWYTLFFIGSGGILVWSAYELLSTYAVMDAGEIESNLRQIWASSNTTYATFDLFAEEVHIPMWLSRLNELGVCAAVLTFTLSARHVWHLVRTSAQKARASDYELARSTEWKPAARVNLVLLVISMPMVFSIMALRSSCSMWALMTGVSGHRGLPWVASAELEMGKCMSNLELASAFQYYTVLSFTQLCGSYLSSKLGVLEVIMKVSSDASVRTAAQNFKMSEYQRSSKFATFLAAYAFVFVGVIVSLLNFFTAEAAVDESYELIADKVDDNVRKTLKSVFLVITVLCVINMSIVTRMEAITEHLGNANMKFMGTRLLLIIAQVQSVVILAFTVGSPSYRFLSEHAEKLGLVEHVRAWEFSEYQALFVHTSLLSFESLLVVILNTLTWHLSQAHEDSLFLFGPDEARETFLPDIEKLLGGLKRPSGDYRALPGGEQ